MNVGTAPSSRPNANASGAETSAPLLTMRGIVKRFGSATALDGVDFNARTGEIHALLGENGAGKSTLMHVLAGLTRPNAGTIVWQGREVRIDSPRAALALGVAMVHQHFTLVPAFTVAENLALAEKRGMKRNGGKKGKTEDRRLAVPNIAASSFLPPPSSLERASSLGWTLDPKSRVEDLPVGTQQRVEIVKALATDAPLLIFDEPTAVLAGQEVEELFAVLRRLRDEGRAIILIAHKLSEILAVADRVTVLRRGHFVASAPVADVTAPVLAAWMVGAEKGMEGNGRGIEGNRGEEKPASREIEQTGNRGEETSTDTTTSPPSLARNVGAGTETCPTEKEAGGLGPSLVASGLVVRGDRGETSVRGLSLEAGRGEIVGIGGVDGNGQTELAEALVGLRPLASGTITWNGKRFQPGNSPRVGYIPQDRRRSGLAITMSVEDNLLFEAAQSPAFRRGPLLRRKALRGLAEQLIREFDIRVASSRLPVSSLSGGNQQKIVVARAFQSKPDWIVAVNPTRGLDIGATRFVHEQLRVAQARGASILLISTDMDEVAALANRAFILSGGTLAPYEPEMADAAELGLLLGGAFGEGKKGRGEEGEAKDSSVEAENGRGARQP